jgi:hypothetical protein
MTFVTDEMGSYDPILSAFTPTKYLGTTNSTSCVTGYDQAAFVAGTSSELFNSFNVSVSMVNSNCPCSDHLGQLFRPLLWQIPLLDPSFNF